MKKILLLAVTGIMILSGCARFAGIPKSYHSLLETSFLKTSAQRADSLKQLILSLPEEMREGAAFLIGYMPQRDLDTLNTYLLDQNIRAAYAARAAHPWAQAIPDSVFLNDVLPYVSLNEERDLWRPGFARQFAPSVDTCTSLRSAVIAINQAAHPLLKVEYNTNREKPDQNPSESIRQLMASCSGLSILLVDAFRSVGIPARVAGTASWADNRGNHNWVEVWVDGEWYFTEYYFNDLNKSWFLADAGQADATQKQYAIWASSFRTTSESFPLVWDEKINYVPAINVTQRYLDLYQQKLEAERAAGDHVTLEVVKFRGGKDTGRSNDRIAINVDVFVEGLQLGGGRTAEPTQDMNDGFKISVPKNKTVLLKYADENGVAQSREIAVQDKDLRIVL